MNDIMKIVIFLEESGLLIKGFIKTKQKNNKENFSECYEAL